MDRESLTARLADLAVSLGANVQPGQIVTVGADHGQSELARCIAESAYKRGAKFVDVQYFDPYVKRARIAYAADETLPFVPSWFSYRMLAIGEERAARISLAGPTTTGLLDDLDPDRAGRDQLPFVKEILNVISDRTTNWTVVPCPTEPWARLVFPDLEPAEALERLWEQVAHVCRLDEPDPVAAWNERADALSAAAVRLNERRFDALHFEGPGDRPDDRAARDVHLPRRPGRDGRRDRPPREPADRGGLRDARSAARRRACALDEAARPRRRHDHPRPRGPVRGRACGRDRRRAGSGCDARAGRVRRGRRRGSARSRSSIARAASAGSAPSSTTRCSTRTPRATSPSATARTRASRRPTAPAATAARSTSTS